MILRLFRHATLTVDLAGVRLLVDPMLDPKDHQDPVPGTPNQRRNPLVDLPEPPEQVVAGVDAVLITHLHGDHLDDTAVATLDPAIPVYCQPGDEAPLRDRGFTAVTPVADQARHGGALLARTGGRHGTGELAEQLGPVSGFVIGAAEEPTLYVAGDTVWHPEVAAALDRFQPRATVVNAGGARFLEGDPITMTAEDVAEVARHAPETVVVAVHLGAINHCVEGRGETRRRIDATGMAPRVRIPDDGERLRFLA